MPQHRVSNSFSRRSRHQCQQDALPLDPALSEVELRSLFERVTGAGISVDFLLAVVEHPAAERAFLARIFERLWLDYAEAWNALAAVPRIQQDPQLRRRVVQGASPEGLERVAPYCTPEDWATIFSRITDPERPSLNDSAMYILSLATPAQLEGVTSELWVKAALQRVSLLGLDLLAYLPGAWRDLRVRKRLEEFADPGTLPSIIVHTRDWALASRLFRRLSRQDAPAAADLLRQEPRVAEKLIRQDLQILFRSADADVREAAFHALQYVPSNT